MRVTESKPAADAAPQGFRFLGRQLVIEAPPASADAPLKLEFHVDSSLLPAGTDPTAVDVFRDGKVIDPCTGDGTKATPAPCVASRTALAGGDAAIVTCPTTRARGTSGWTPRRPTRSSPMAPVRRAPAARP